MTKLGKVKSWCIDPEDNKLTYTQHNTLFVEVIDGKKFFTARHDSVDSEDYDTTVETGTFELGGETYNARFADIFGRENYTNVTL